MNSNRLNQLFDFLAASPQDSFILFAIAKEYEKYDERAKAFEYYLKLKEVDPNYVGLYYHLGKLYEKATQYDDALKAYNEGLTVAKSAGDRHAEGELAEAKMILVEDFFDEE